ncbi:MAG: hypothetical protein WC310_00320 [Patescibacteria group bacterium]|jgi:hypothetical protein
MQHRGIFFHHTRDVVDGMPELLFSFPLRMLIAARQGDKVVLPIGVEPLELELLNRLGFGPRPEDVVYVDGNLTSADLHGKVFPFSGCSVQQRQMVELAGLDFAAPSLEICRQADSKAFFQSVLHDLRLRPFGRIVVTGDRERMKEVVKEMLSRHGSLLLKAAHSTSGLQQHLIMSLADLPEDLALKGKAVVQEFIPHVVSPSAQYYLKPGGNWKLNSMTTQILDGRHHVGNIFPPTDLSPEVIAEIEKIGSRIVPRYAELGYYGPLSVDFMLTENNRLFPCEVNARVTAPWYPWEAARRNLGAPVPFWMKSLRINPKTTIAKMEKVLGKLLFNPKTKKGALPFSFLPKQNFTYLVIYGSNQNEFVNRLVPQVQWALAKLG